MTLPHVFLVAMDKFSLVAVPLFILTAELLVAGGGTKRLIRFVDAWVGHLPGGLGIVVVMACVIFGAITGSSSACAAAMGLLMVQAMTEHGYDRKFSLSTVACASPLGLLIPPSIPLILYGAITEVSIGKLFLASFAPGLLIALGLAVVVVVTSTRQQYGRKEPANWKLRWDSLGGALGVLIIPLVLILLIYTGVASPTEAGAVSAVLSVLVGAFLYRELTFKNFMEAVRNTARSTCMIFMIIGGAVLFGNALTFQGVATAITEAVVRSGMSAAMFMLVTVLLYLVMGMFLEAVSIIYITIPLFFGLMLELGIDPIHFGMLMNVMMAMAQVTPPVGLCLYVTSGVTNSRFEDVCSNIWWYLVVYIIVAVLIVFVPELSLFAVK